MHIKLFYKLLLHINEICIDFKICFATNILNNISKRIRFIFEANIKELYVKIFTFNS